jgi:serine protease AprX
MRWLTLILLFPLCLSAQDYKYWVSFADKGPQTLQNATPALSERALERRAKQNIPLHSTDLPVFSEYIQEISDLGFKILNHSRWFNGVMVGTSDYSLATALTPLLFVESVYDFETQISTSARLKDKFEEIDSLAYGTAYHQLEMLGGDVLHQQGFRGRGMQLAVLDAGFYKANELAAFDHLFANGQVLGTWNFVAGETDVYDDHNHGMAVLSTMGAHLPNEMIGTAPEASYWLLRTEDAGSENLIEEYNWLCGAEFADSVGADIINSSLGYTTFDVVAQNHTYADMNGVSTPISRAATMAARKGIIVCNSAGNSGNDSWHYIGAPADADSILSVGAVYANEAPTNFSSYGPSSDGRVKPTISAQGGSAVVYSTSNQAGISNGTSFSSPIIAGMTASLWQAHPDKTNIEVMNAIIQSAHLYDNPTNQLGYGIPNYAIAHVLLQEVKDVHQPSLTVYPNPITSNSKIFIYTAQNEGMSYKLCDMQGRLVAKGNSAYAYAVEEISLPILSTGMYVLEVRVGTNNFSERLLLVE